MNDTTLVFDLDDTLYPEREFVRSGFAAVDSCCRRESICSTFFATACRIFDQGERLRVFDEALHCQGVTDTAAIVPRLVTIYRNHAPAIWLSRDADQTLAHFARVCNLAVLTDGYLQTQQNKAAALQLDSRVNRIVYSDEFGRSAWKPSPTPYTKLMEEFPASRRFIYVADNPLKDFIGARALGWRTVRLRNGGLYATIDAPPAYEADVTVRHLEELCDPHIWQAVSWHHR